MTLHNTVENLKKAGIGTGIGIIGIIILVMLFRVGVAIKDTLYPPKVEPPSYAYDTLPPLNFPKSIASDLTYNLSTVTGDFPEFPDRLNIYPIAPHPPNFLNLGKAKDKVRAIGFQTPTGKAIQEVHLDDANYEWDEQTGIRRKIIMDINTFNFVLNSSYLSSLAVLNAQYLSDEKSAINTARGFLDSMEIYPSDIDLEKTQNPAKGINYNTYPQLFSIDHGALVPASSLADAQVIRVDLYQKDMEYKLNTGRSGSAGTELIDMKVPILYPHPPYSTMSFWIASSERSANVDAANFVHQDITVPEDVDATYPIKTAEAAFEELKNGQGYVAAYAGSDKSIFINNIYLAYYLGESPQSYLMPIIVFEGNNGFFAYVSAVDNEWVK